VTDDTIFLVSEAGEDSSMKSDGKMEGLGPAGAERVKHKVDRKSDDGVNDEVGEGE
jgi:hypothetical protein